jgi:xylose dehydrogenase (NAD/NADP)
MNNSSQSSTINWGVLGCANIADKAVIPGILEATNANLYGIASRNAEKLQDFANRHNPTKSYGSYEDLLDDPAIDAVYIPLPNGLHYQWTMKALEKGKHVLCEKPLGVTPEEVEKLFSTAKLNGVHLMEAFAYRHSPLISKIKDLCTSNIIGQLTYIDSQFSFRLEDLENVRLSPELAGGATYDIGCYNLSIIRHLAGEEPSTIQAVGDIGTKSNVDETSIANLVFPSGLKATSFCSFRAPFRSEFTVMGTKGFIRVPVGFNSKGSLKITLHQGPKSEQI